MDSQTLAAAQAPGCQQAPILLEIACAQRRDRPRRANALGELPHDPAAVFEPPRPDLARRDAAHLVREELVAQLFDRKLAITRGHQLATRVQICGGSVIMFKRGVGIGPDPEEADLAEYSLSAPAVGMHGQRK